MITPNEPTEPEAVDVDDGQPVRQIRSGRYQFACGHTVVAALDVEQRHRCSTCRADTIVIRVVK